MRFGQTIFYNMQKLYLTWGGHFTSVFLHIFVNFKEKEPSAKFYGVLIIFQKLMKFRSWVELEFSDVIPTNVHNMRFSAAYNALGQELVSFRSSENTYFCRSWFLLLCLPCTFLVYVGKFNLWWAEMRSCEVIYYSNTTGKTPGKISCFPFPNPKN